MVYKIFLFLTVIAYSLFISQSFFYIVALKEVQLQLSAASFIEFRQMIDKVMRVNYSYVIYATLILQTILILMSLKGYSKPCFFLLTASFLLLLADVIITLKVSLPINDTINSWSVDNLPKNWTDIREQWFSVFKMRQICSVTGYCLLLLFALFNKK